MENRYLLSASIICADPVEIARDVRALDSSGIDSIHFDVMDGQFVPRYGLPPETLSGIRKISNTPIDAHLMVMDAEPYVDAFVSAGANTITFSIESSMHAHRTARKIKSSGAKVGVAINPATNFDVLEYLVDDIDLVLVMAINPGIVGHKLIPSAIAKIGRLRQWLDERGKDVEIEIDGGVTFDSAADMICAGATMLVCGSSTIFQPGFSVSGKLIEFREHLQRSLSERGWAG